MIPAIFGLSGPAVTGEERAFFRDADPAGYILFGRNCREPEQLRALTGELRALSGRDRVPILIDQEGGQVARLRPPAWPEFPAPERFAWLYEKAPISAIEAARINAEAMGLILEGLGITVNCTPVLDLACATTDAALSGRTLGEEPMQVAALGRAVLEGLEAGGVIGVVKHMPGQGRAPADSHAERPVVTACREELAADLAPFRALAGAPMGMVAHVVYAAWDERACASQSSEVIDHIIRGSIGFDGFLMSDDIGMKALDGPLGARAAAAVTAGCDAALHGSGNLPEMMGIAAALEPMEEESQRRLGSAMRRVAGTDGRDSYEALAERRDALLAFA